MDLQQFDITSAVEHIYTIESSSLPNGFFVTIYFVLQNSNKLKSQTNSIQTAVQYVSLVDNLSFEVTSFFEDYNRQN